MFDSRELGNLSDIELLREMRSFQNGLTADAAALNLSDDELEAMAAISDEFGETITQWKLIKRQEAAISAAKKQLRKKVLAELRQRRKEIYADEKVSVSALASYGMPPRNKTKTRTPKPETAPFGWVDYAKLQHKIHFRDSAAPNRRAKPAKVYGCEIWYFVGDAPPVSAKELDYLETARRSPFKTEYKMEDAGKRVFYMLRWVSPSGERGEWSETIEATING